MSGFADQVGRNAGYLGEIDQYLSANANKTDHMQGLLQQMAPAAPNY